MIRPEDLEVTVNGSGPAQFSARLESTFFLGSQVRLTLDATGQRLVLDAPNHVPIDLSAPVGVRVREGKAFAWPKD
jgi:ABC-type Fe3+/spermidine/putrescine transport system ATPase subunit